MDNLYSAKFSYNRIVSYAEHFRSNKAKIDKVFDSKSLSAKRFNGLFSKGSKKAMENTLRNWMSSYEAYDRYCFKNKRNNKIKLVFVTLTMSAQQIHSDQLIKEKCLNQFIKELKAKYNLKNYVWKAELQDNYNIHFHLIIDCYINKKVLQHIWNRCQNLLGYIDRFEKKYSHKNPPSTHVSMVNSQKNIMSYISKYMSKDNCLLMPLGRIWGCSDELRELKEFECSSSDVSEIINTATNVIETPMIIEDEFFSMAIYKKSLLQVLPECWLKKKYEVYLLNNWALIYNLSLFGMQ
jgi:hypothetical protein